jgi:hypothetical protein
MALNTQIFHPHKTKQPEKNNARYNSKMKKTLHAYTRRTKKPNHSSQSLYYSHFYFNKQPYAQNELAQQKEQRMP